MSQSREFEVLKVVPHGILCAITRLKSSVPEEGADPLDLLSLRHYMILSLRRIVILSLRHIWRCREIMSE